MTAFSDDELAFLRSARLLGRLATVGREGMPHVTPVGWSLGPGDETIQIGGRNFAQSKKFRDVIRTQRAAIVIDEVLPPWQPRGIEIRGRAEAIDAPEPHIVIHADRVIAWGLDEASAPPVDRTEGVTIP